MIPYILCEITNMTKKNGKLKLQNAKISRTWRTQKKKLVAYSRGMNKRLGHCFKHFSWIRFAYFCDEPTSCIRSNWTKRCLAILKKFIRISHRCTFRLHHLADVESIADEVAICMKDKIARNGQLAELTKSQEQSTVKPLLFNF